MNFQIKELTNEDIELFHSLLDCFEEGFEDTETYGSNRPNNSYLADLLDSENFIALAAVMNGVVIAGLTAYELKKFEQERSEIYIYDLAVLKSYRRKGLASKIIEALRSIALERNACVIYVQADIEDDPAIELYTKFGTREDVLHFDIPVKPMK